MPSGKQLFIGTSGFSYPHWKGIFYPNSLKPNDWLTYYSHHFNTVELNTTFYRLPSEKTLNRWCKATPSNFVFAVKASHFITHIKHLQQVDEPINNFLARISLLTPKLAPVLFQLPPSLPLSLEHLADFLRCMRSQMVIPTLRIVLEVRHPSWLVSQVFTLLNHYNVALCLADGAMLPVQAPLTADFVYIRRHGATSRYSSCYSSERLQEEAEQIRAWLTEGRDVYVYFNNDACGYAVQNALYVKELLTTSLCF